MTLSEIHTKKMSWWRIEILKVLLEVNFGGEKNLEAVSSVAEAWTKARYTGG